MKGTGRVVRRRGRDLILYELGPVKGFRQLCLPSSLWACFLLDPFNAISCSHLPLSFKKWASLVAQMVKNQPAMQESQVRSLGWEDPLEKGMATHSSILVWRIPWTEKLVRLQSMELQRVGYNLKTKQQQ